MEIAINPRVPEMAILGTQKIPTTKAGIQVAHGTSGEMRMIIIAEVMEKAMEDTVDAAVGTVITEATETILTGTSTGKAFSLDSFIMNVINIRTFKKAAKYVAFFYIALQ